MNDERFISDINDFKDSNTNTNINVTEKHNFPKSFLPIGSEVLVNDKSVKILDTMPIYNHKFYDYVGICSDSNDYIYFNDDNIQNKDMIYDKNMGGKRI